MINKVLILIGIVVLFPAQFPVSDEYQIKAVFLFNFAQFVDWPNDTFEQGKRAPFVIGILGTDPFGTFLRETIQGEQIEGHPLRIQKFNSAEEVSGCHILFIHTDAVDQLEDISSQLQSKSILTVSDNTRFIEKGGIIRFFLENGRIRLEINIRGAEKADIKISSKLLSVAKITKE